MDADLFTEGAIYWYENKTNTKKDYDDENLNQDFIVSRPVYIMKSNKTVFDEFTINVLVITSSPRRIGIPININGIRNGKILPYNIRSVHTKYLTKYMGHVSQDIMDEVGQAVAYHLKYSDIKPKYLEEYELSENTKKKCINELNDREMTVYDFINKKCLFKSNYYSESQELFQLYCKMYPDNGYHRLRDFNMSLSKIINIFSDVSIKEEHKKKIITGLSINGNVHKIDIPEATFEQVNHKKKIIEDEFIDVSNMNRDQLLDILDQQSKKVYFSLDIIQKIDIYNRNDSNIKFTNVPKKDIPIIHQLVRFDIDEKKQKVFKLLDQNVNPLNMNTVNQYVIFICTNEELLKHIDIKYLKKGGLPKLRKLIKNNIHHYFVKCKY